MTPPRSSTRPTAPAHKRNKVVFDPNGINGETLQQRILIADLFCGAGGFSTGAVRALRKMGVQPLLTCVNHWPVAIESHSLNHPEARHYIMDLASAVPRELVPEGYLDLLMASPTCTHHSRARGGKPTSDQQRSDPHHILEWCTELKVRRLMIENVPEFRDWGPVDSRSGKPIRSRKGQYFQAWVRRLKEIGFTQLEYRVLNAADYGDATTRERFFLMARSDGKAIQWPEPTHSRTGEPDLFGNGGLKWRAAKDIINWDDPGLSIFDRKRPLSPNTIRRIATGLVKFGGESAYPFLEVLRDEGLLPEDFTMPAPPKTHGETPSLLVQTNKGDQGDTATRSVEDPLYTVLTRSTLALAEPLLLPAPLILQINQGHARHGTQRTVHEPMYTVLTRDTHGLAIPELHPFLCANRTHNTAKGIHEPIPVITTSRGGGIFFAHPFLTPFTLGQQSSARARSTHEPIATIATSGKISLIQPLLTLDVPPFLLGQQGGSTPRKTLDPVPTITGNGFIRLFIPELTPFILNRHGDNFSGNRTHSIEGPFPTATCHGAGYLVEPYLVNLKGASTAHSLLRPTPTITAHAPHLYLAEPLLINLKRGTTAHSTRSPVPTLTAHASHLALAEAFLVVVNHGDGAGGDCSRRLKSLRQPLPTITTSPGLGVAEPFITPFYGWNVGTPRGAESVRDPLGTITAQGTKHGLCRPFLTPYYSSYVGTSAAADDVNDPLATITSRDRFALCQPFLVPQFGERPRQPPRSHGVHLPLPAVTSHGAGALVRPLVLRIDHAGALSGIVRPVDDPLHTLTGKGTAALVWPALQPLLLALDPWGETCMLHLPHAPEGPTAAPEATEENPESFIVTTRHARGGPRPRPTRDPLPTITAGGSQVALVQPHRDREPTAQTSSGRIVWINGTPYRLDIRFRMLRNPELARAMGFSDEETEYEFAGTQTDITKQVGNAVPVHTATALVAALLHDVRNDTADPEPPLPDHIPRAA